MLHLHLLLTCKRKLFPHDKFSSIRDDDASMTDRVRGMDDWWIVTDPICDHYRSRDNLVLSQVVSL